MDKSNYAFATKCWRHQSCLAFHRTRTRDPADLALSAFNQQFPFTGNDTQLGLRRSFPFQVQEKEEDDVTCHQHYRS